LARIIFLNNITEVRDNFEYETQFKNTIETLTKDLQTGVCCGVFKNLLFQIITGVGSRKYAMPSTIWTRSAAAGDANRFESFSKHKMCARGMLV
jgi:hypothetical protein